MIITKNIDVKINNNYDVKYYNEKGYKCVIGDVITINVNDLKKESKEHIKYQCDMCKDIIEIKYVNYVNRNKTSNIYCNRCSNEIKIQNKNIENEYYNAKNGFKICRKCNKELPANKDFYFIKKDTFDGFNHRCKKCCGKDYTDNIERRIDEGFFICIKCNRKLPYTYNFFPKDKSCKNGLRNVCRECNPKYKNFIDENSRICKSWTDDEINILKEKYSNVLNDELLENYLPNRSLKSVQNKASLIGVSKDSKTLLATKRKAQIKGAKKRTGFKMSDEQKKKISKTKKEYFKTHTSPLKGRKMPPEHGERTRLNNIKLGLWKGDNNPSRNRDNHGSNNYNWKGGITDLYKKLREFSKEWQDESMRICNYSCVITGKSFDNIHHIYSFRKIVEESFNELGFDIKNEVKDYTEYELNIIKNKIMLKHIDYGFGACINSKVHILFHTEYSYKDFNHKDFLNFVNDIKKGKYNKWFKENNLDININDKFIKHIVMPFVEKNLE